MEADCSKLPGEGCYAKLLAVAGDKRRAYIVLVRRRAVYSTIAGPVKGEAIIECGWGGRLETGRGTVYIVKPSWIELVENKGVRGTQVIYPKDSAYIALKAGVRRGHKVFEAGTGSGFLTIVLAWAVCPEGRIVSFEPRQEFAEAARHNLKLAGTPEDCVEIIGGPVEEGLDRYPPESFDAGFLDLPDPWTKLEHAWRALKRGAPLTVFLPTTSQIDKLLSRLNDNYAVETVEEILLREWQPNPGALRPSPRMIGHTGFIVRLRKILL